MLSNPARKVAESDLGLEQEGEKKVMLSFRKGEVNKERSAIDHIFTPRQEKYQNPEELVVEFRTFVNQKLQEGDIVHVREEHARVLAKGFSRQAEREKREAAAMAKEQQQKTDELKDGSAIEKERKSIAKTIAKGLGLGLVSLAVGSIMMD